jgi:hypothetical protein
LAAHTIDDIRSIAPTLPNKRTGRIFEFQLLPATHIFAWSAALTPWDFVLLKNIRAT